MAFASKRGALPSLGAPRASSVHAAGYLGPAVSCGQTRLFQSQPVLPTEARVQQLRSFAPYRLLQTFALLSPNTRQPTSGTQRLYLLYLTCRSLSRLRPLHGITARLMSCSGHKARSKRFCSGDLKNPSGTAPDLLGSNKPDLRPWHLRSAGALSGSEAFASGANGWTRVEGNWSERRLCWNL
jgi:hypothetical protein